MEVLHRKMNTDNKIYWIIQNNPFQEITGTLESAKNIKNESATTGNVFCITNTKKKKYKLSFYKNEETAIRIENNIMICPHLFPKYYGRKKNLLLFDWIEGNVLTNMLSNDTILKVGIVYGEIHKLNDTIKSKTGQKKIEKLLLKLFTISQNNQEYLSQKIYKNIEEKMLGTFQHLNHDLILEMNDANPANFMLNTNGQLIIVDEEALNHNIKGRGLIGLLNNFNNEQKKIFWRGYKQNHPNDYFTKDYEDSLKIFFIINIFVHRFNKYGKEHKKTQKSYEELLNLI